jgi:hypothetical protein
MGQNAIEIVLDTSKTMNNKIFSAMDLTKFNLAKEILFNIFDKWNVYNCNHQLYIRYLQNSKIVTVKNINEIDKIEPKEQAPLHQVIESAIDRLENIDKKYKNRIIIILTDGKNDYQIDQDRLTSKVKIYTMEIKGHEGVENLTLKYLAQETKGINYSVFVNGVDEKDIERIYSEIKKYLKCTKFRNLASLSLFFIGIPLYLFTPQGCSPFNNGLLENSSISSCKNETINTIKLTKCRLLSKKSVEATVYNYGSLKVISLRNFASVKSNIPKEYKLFLKEILEKMNIKRPKSIKIVGHTDLQGIKNKESHNFNQNCIKYHVPKNTNECLGNDRAFQVKKIFSNLDYNLRDVSAKYNDDFFMRNLNDQLGGSLWKALDLKETISLLEKELNIKKDYEIKKIRDDKSIEQKIRVKKKYYQEKFTPFRNIVILIQNN